MVFNAPIRKLFALVLVALVLGGALTASFYAAAAIEGNEMARSLIADLGYVGVLIVAIIAGLNAFVPIPAATFVPIFLAGNLEMHIIVAMLVIGTIIADLIGFYLGRISSRFVTDHYPKTQARFTKLHEERSRWLVVFVFLYAAFVPFPNEAYLIPFGIIGVPLRTFIIPLILGAIVYQTLAAYGIENVFRYFF